MFNMKIRILLIFLLLSSFVFAQNDEENIKNTIHQLFEGMKTGDSALVKKTFHPEVKMQTIFTNKEGLTKLHDEKLENFLKAIGTPHDGVWNEKITFTSIQIDDNLAHVWTDYQFYLDDQFIHCGVNSFQLVKLNEQWQIVHLIDTRRKMNYNKKEFNR